MKLSGHTRPYAVLGHPIGHTLSPAMHNASFRALDLDAIYLAFDVAPDRLRPVLRAMADMGFGGVNLTVPLKETALAGMDELDDSARRLGSVNTVEFSDGALRGHSTDGAGFVQALEEAFAIQPRAVSVFLLGCGGAGRAVALACALAQAPRIALADTDRGRAKRLADEIVALGAGAVVELVDAADPAAQTRACHTADLAIQATPVGMKPSDPPLLGPDAFRTGQWVYDLIYMHPETPFMKAARQGGARAENGLGMLLHQGARSYTIWTGQTPDVPAMRAALEAEVYGPP